MPQPVQNLVDLEKEISEKIDWEPTEEDAEYRSAIQKRFQWAVWQFTNANTFIQEMSPLEYYEMNLKDSVLVTEPLPDPDDWRNNIRLNDIIDKRDAFLSFRESIKFKPEFQVHDVYGMKRANAEDMADALVQFAMEQDDYREKQKLYNYGLFDFGTQFVRVTWEEKQQIKRIERSAFKPEDSPDKYESYTRYGGVFKHIKTDFVQFNRVFLGDYAQWFIDDQPYYFIDYVLPYETAYQLFHKWKRWKFVKPYMPENDAWTDLLPDYELDDNAFNRKVRVRIMEDLPNKEYALMLNNVIMTPRGLKLPNDCYSLTMQQAGVLNPRFAIGKSFLANIHNYAMIKDLMANIMVDRSRQGLEQPLKSSFRTLLNRHLFRPGNVAQILGNGTLEPLIPESSMTNFSLEVYKMFEQQMDKASINPIMQGQQGSPQETKWAVQQQLYQSLRAVELWVQASARMEYQIMGKMLDLALKYYPTIKPIGAKAKEVSSFVVSSSMGAQTEVKFQKLPPPEDKSARMILLSDMSKREKEAKAKGQDLKIYICDPTDTSNWRWKMKLNIVPSAPETKAYQEDQAKQDYMTILQDQGLDPDFGRRQWFKAKGWDFEEAKAKPPKEPPKQPPMQPGQPEQPGAEQMPQDQAQMGQPTQPQMPPQSAPMNPQQMQAQPQPQMQ